MKRYIFFILFVLSAALFGKAEEWLYVCNVDDRRIRDHELWISKEFEKKDNGNYRIRTKEIMPGKRYYTGRGTYYTSKDKERITMYEVSKDLKKYKYIGSMLLESDEVIEQSYNSGNRFDHTAQWDVIETRYNDSNSKVWRAIKELLQKK